MHISAHPIVQVLLEGTQARCRIADTASSGSLFQLSTIILANAIFWHLSKSHRFPDNALFYLLNAKISADASSNKRINQPLLSSWPTYYYRSRTFGRRNVWAPVWYENLSGVVSCPENSNINTDGLDSVVIGSRDQ